jgi:hypothetical protein
MCHHYDRATRRDERADAEERWTPDEFEEERDVDVELVTDGGDE